MAEPARIGGIMIDIRRVLTRAAVSTNNAVYRASRGRLMGKVRGAPVLLLTVPCRTTGRPHTTPVSYLPDGERFVVTGSAGGSPHEPQWFRNLRAADRAVIEVGDRRLDVDVKVADSAERAALWARLVERSPFFATYQAKVEREIPMAILSPRR